VIDGDRGGDDSEKVVICVIGDRDHILLRQSHTNIFFIKYVQSANSLDDTPWHFLSKQNLTLVDHNMPCHAILLH